MTVAELARWLPAIDDARRWSQSLAVLDAIVCEEQWLRIFSFDSRFGSGQAQASMWNGSGDEYSITFGEYGALVLGFDHTSELSASGQDPPALWPGLFTGLPPVLAKVARQSVRTCEGVPEVTVALWRLAGDEQWRHGPVEYPTGCVHRYGTDHDGSGWLFKELDGRPGTYLAYAREIHERELPADAVTATMTVPPTPMAAAVTMGSMPGRTRVRQRRHHEADTSARGTWKGLCDGPDRSQGGSPVSSRRALGLLLQSGHCNIACDSIRHSSLS
jgi:hypothetical protein